MVQREKSRGVAIGQGCVIGPGTRSLRRGYFIEPWAAGEDLITRGKPQEAFMTHWHDTMVDRPESDGAVYATGWTISGLAVLGTVIAVWLLGI